MQEITQIHQEPELGKAIASVSPWAEAWRRFKRHRLAFYSLWLLGLMVLAVLLGPLVYKVGVNEVDFLSRLAGPSPKHPMGTDDLGRDMLARMLYGGRISLAHEETAMRQIQKQGMWTIDELREMVPANLMYGLVNPAPPAPDLDLPGRPVAPSQ